MKKEKKIKKNKEGKKFSIFKWLFVVLILSAIITGLYFFLTVKDENTGLTVIERQWISRNKKTLIDINVPNNLSIVADNGEGLVFDYLTKVEEETGLKFNKKSYNYKTDNSKLDGLSIVVLTAEDKVLKSDVLIAEDEYVLVGSTDGYANDLNDLYGKKIGVLKQDKKIISESINSKYTYTEYNTINDLFTNLKSKKIDFVIIPRYYALKSIVSNNFVIKYNFTNLSNKIMLRPSKDDKLSSVMTKYLNNFKNKDYMTKLEDSYMKFYTTNTNTTDIDKTSLSSKVYTYGYVKGSTYNVLDGKKLYGYAGEYINLLSRMGDISLSYKEFESKEKLKDAIKDGSVDIAFIDFEYTNEDGLYTVNAFNPTLVAASKTNYDLSSKEGLENRQLYVLKDTYLENYLKDNYNSFITSMSSINKDITKEGIIVLDEVDYYYYASKGKFDSYYMLFKDNYTANYRYYVKSDEKALYDFINFMLKYNDNGEVKTNSISRLSNSINSKDGFTNSYLTLMFTILIPLLILFLLVALARLRRNRKSTRKEDILKYNDMMTSLKNRNYLNANIEKWDDAKVNPRTIIIVDLNNLKYINDNYGQEEGDNLIKKAAAILINTQLEKSEIIRTSGNEFLIYAIGYTEKQISTYKSKLVKEFEKLPHGFGAAIGYSMIEDEIKTIDDAINEAALEMRTDKEQNYR